MLTVLCVFPDPQSKVGNKWSEVAKHIPGRTGQQCAQRWRHKVTAAGRCALFSNNFCDVNPNFSCFLGLSAHKDTHMLALSRKLPALG
jgi:hypothetical protein